MFQPFKLLPTFRLYLCPLTANSQWRHCSSNAGQLYAHTKRGLEILGKDTMVVHENMITEEEERSLMKEIEPYFKRTKYESSHWDHVRLIYFHANYLLILSFTQAIIAYRETEKSSWNPQNQEIINRIRNFVFNEGLDNVERKPLAHVHVLDLAKEGEIKPHVDSVKFCGDTIAGLSLLSPSVMRLVHEKDSNEIIDVKLEQRSLYIMKNQARYDFSHAILGMSDSIFNGDIVPRDRRVSIIFRCEPNSSTVEE